jgi:hypothetical protein
MTVILNVIRTCLIYCALFGALVAGLMLFEFAADWVGVRFDIELALVFLGLAILWRHRKGYWYKGLDDG